MNKSRYHVELWAEPDGHWYCWHLVMSPAVLREVVALLDRLQANDVTGDAVLRLSDRSEEQLSLLE